MAATTYSNVINLQPGGPGVSATSNRILMECRDLAARRLREAMREIVQKVSADLGQRADTTTGSNDRRSLLRIKDALSEKIGRLEGQLAAHWAREFDTALKGTSVAAPADIHLEMQIVEFGEMDEELALKSLAHRLHATFEDELYALGRRFNYLLGKEDPADGRNPAAPEVFTRALQGALRDMDFDTPDRLEICRGLEGYAADHIGPIYHAVNAQLLKHNVLPNIRRDYGRSSGQVGRKEATKNSASGDMFAMLQRLVTGSVIASNAEPKGGVPGATVRGSGVEAADGIVGSGGGWVPPPHLWASLETLQHAAPSIGIGQPSVTEGANVLHHFRASEVGQALGQLDAITVDIVAMLFDMIFDDREIADPIKALVGRLQIPVLKVAMLDRSFFSTKAHPTRRLLDLISRAAIRWGREVGHDDLIYQKVAEIIDQIHKNFQQDTALFGTLCDDLERFLTEQETKATGNVNRAALLVIQRELDELADMTVESELQTWLALPLPQAITDLLNREWRALLKRTHLEDGPDSDAWKFALKTASDLVESATPKRDTQNRQALVRQLPIILKQLSAGFDRIGVNDERRHALLDGLFSLHASALRGADAPPSVDEADHKRDTTPVMDETGVISQALGDGEVTVESISLKSPMTSFATSQDVEQLRRGDWVEFVQPDATAIRYRLSWISPQRGIFLFTNPQSPHALAVSPEAMSLQLQHGEVRILPTEPMFDRALSRTIEILQAA